MVAVFGRRSQRTTLSPEDAGSIPPPRLLITFFEDSTWRTNWGDPVSMGLSSDTMWQDLARTVSFTRYRMVKRRSWHITESDFLG
jgi:hypothetical protein